jgi:hypothetical protein
MELKALRLADFEWTTHVDGVWSDPPHDVPALHRKVRDELAFQIDQLAQRPGAASPLGIVLTGEAGSGKTHLLSALRKISFARGAGFALIDMTDVKDFWATAQLGFVSALQRPGPSGRRQLSEILQHLLASFGGPSSRGLDVDALAALRPPRLINVVDDLIAGLGQRYPLQTTQYRDVVRALALINSDAFEIASIGYGWLQGMGLEKEEHRLLHDFRTDQMQTSHLLRALSWLNSLRAPMVIALDQLDAIVAEQNLASDPLSPDPAAAARQNAARAIIDRIAGGLMDLQGAVCRSLVVVSCLEATWSALVKKALASAPARFQPPIELVKPDLVSFARQMVASRLADSYRRHAVTPPYETWPFAPSAFEGLTLTPREVLKRCHQHVRACIGGGRITELVSLDSRAAAQPGPSPADELSMLDGRYAALQREAKVDRLKNERAEAELDRLLEEACLSLAAEEPLPESKDALVDRDFEGTGSFDPLHARIRLVHHDQGDREQHYSFRFLEHANAIAFQARLNAAITAAGIDRQLDFRKLVILRFGPLPGGKKTQELVAQFASLGGRFQVPTDHDLRAMSALAALRAEVGFSALEPWLRARRPASQLALFRDARRFLFENSPRDGAPAPTISPEPRAEPRAQSEEASASYPPQPAQRHNPLPGANCGAAPAAEPSRPPSAEGAIPIGNRIVAGSPGPEVVRIPLEQLCKHTVILAGAGSGKTMLVRRIVEEAALQKVPAIVLDPAGDLARLGDPWPEPPAEFDEADREKAWRYLALAEVLVFTPGRTSGNPLRLEPLPDLSSLSGDEYTIARDMARSALEPLALGTGSAAKKGRLGVLTTALDYHAKRGTPGLGAFIALLSDLPEEAAGGFEKAQKHAREMADALREQQQINPLLRSEGEPLDPAILFGDAAGASGRTRVSVVSFIGLPSLELQQSFVNQLAMTLFGWIRANPKVEGRALRGLLVVDEAKDFAPATSASASGASLIRLANQARKYGLGLVFATQAPKSLDHNIVANCATQLYGRASSPAAQDVIREQIQARGGSGEDVAKLVAGTFYAHTEGMSSPAKVKARFSLSHHPKNPLSSEEVLDRAARSRRAVHPQGA